LAEEGEFAVTVPGGDPVPAQLVGRDATTDIALLRIDRPDLQPLPLAATSFAVGALAIAVGSDDGAPIAALGVVSRAGGPWRSLRGGEIDARIELDLRLRRSAEGGVALDASGAAFGMAVFGPRRRVLVIPAATIERVAAKLASDGRIPRGYLGLGLHPVALTGGGGAGAMVMSVDPKGPGAAAGVHQGDVIVALNGEPIRHVQSLLRALGPDRVGQTVTLDLRRAGETKQLSLTIGERPAA
jgi:S1-C subfamily serine protease